MARPREEKRRIRDPMAETPLLPGPARGLTLLYAEKSSTARTGAEEATAAKRRCGNWWGEVVRRAGLGPPTFRPMPRTPRVVPGEPLCAPGPWGAGCGKPFCRGRVWGEGVPIP